jgi:cobalt-zinc-cadmium efflux system outer membrane protein
MIYLQLNTNQIIPKVDELPKTDVLSSLTPFALKDTALKYRPDYQWSKLNFAYQQQNYSYQKSLAIPDFRIGYNFDKAGNFILNYNALSLSMDLPVFNRNQGNIKASEFLMKQSLTEVQQKEQEIFGELVAGIQQVKNLYSLYEQVQGDFIKNFENVKDGMQENFKKRNISVIEYTDFFESYINSVQQYYSLLMKYHLSVEQLNYVVSKKIIR